MEKSLSIQTSNLNELVEVVHTNARQKGFHNPTPDFPTIIALIHSELSEALESYRNGEPMSYLKDGKPEGAAVELVDAVIRIMDWFGSQPHLDLNQLIIDKHSYNTTRSFRHGGKKI